jgi:RNA methyltransferase, TrmH family
MPDNKYQIIASPQNERIKFLDKLKQKKHRLESRRFAVENLAIVMDAQKAGFDFEALFVTQKFAKKHPRQLAELEEGAETAEFFLIDENLNKKYSSLDTPSGITAVYEIKEKELSAGPVVYLNGISDPGNLGTIMRTALAFGFKNLVLDEDCVDIYNPKTVSAAKDAIFKLNFKEDKTGEWLANNKLPVYTSSSHAGDSLGGFEPASAYCLVLGSESHGVSPEILKLATKCVKIDISPEIESLNVAAAAAILFYEFRKK